MNANRQRAMAPDVSGAVSAADDAGGSAGVSRALEKGTRGKERGEGKGSRAKRVVTLTLPWPPTVNTYWRRNGHRYFITPAGIEFRQDVWNVAMTMRSCYDRAPLTGPVAVSVRGNPPDNRRRDLDNILKALCDSLKYASVYQDDSQIVRLEVEKVGKVRAGTVVVTVEEQ